MAEGEDTLTGKRRVHFACDCGASIVCFDISGVGHVQVTCNSCKRIWEQHLTDGSWVKKLVRSSRGVKKK